MGSLLGGAKPPAPPKLKAPAEMPNTDMIALQKKKAATLASQQSGRSSTVLSEREGL
jgi:hypothetical protein